MLALPESHEERVHVEDAGIAEDHALLVVQVNEALLLFDRQVLEVELDGAQRLTTKILNVHLVVLVGRADLDRPRLDALHELVSVEAAAVRAGVVGTPGILGLRLVETAGTDVFH